MQKCKQDEQLVVYVKDCEAWLEESEIDTKADNLILVQSNMIRISSAMSKKLLRYKYLSQLSLEGCQLSQLDGLPKLPFLLRLDLTGNQ